MALKEDMDIIKSLSSNDHYPILGVDLDGTITDGLLVFKIMMDTWPGKVIVITYREDAEKAKAYLDDNYIKYDKLILAKDMDKSEIIKNEGVDLYIDDQDEMIQNIPEDVTVLKMRNGGNFDYDDKKWLYSKKTGKVI